MGSFMFVFLFITFASSFPLHVARQLQFSGVLSANGEDFNRNSRADLAATSSDNADGPRPDEIEATFGEVKTTFRDPVEQPVVKKERPNDDGQGLKFQKSRNETNDREPVEQPKKTSSDSRKDGESSNLVDNPQPINIILTHSTADFDALASAVGLAKLWSKELDGETFVVMPRGAHASVRRYLSLHEHLFPIKDLRSVNENTTNRSINMLALVDAQRRDRIGPAEPLLAMAKSVTIVDHHIDTESDIPEATEYIVDEVGSVTTLIVERLMEVDEDLTEAEATLLALGIHADTGSLCFDSTSPRDARALWWVMEQGASQTAIAEHAQASLSEEQQGVLTQTLVNANSTTVHGVTVSSVLLGADGFINGLAAVTQDALELSSSDVFLVALVYEARSGGSKRKGTERVKSQLLKDKVMQQSSQSSSTMQAEAWRGGEEALRRRRLLTAFERKDIDGSGYLEKSEIAAALAASGIVATQETVDSIMEVVDTDGDGRVDFEEFVAFSDDAQRIQEEQQKLTGRRASTMIIIGRVRAGVNTKAVKLNKLLERFGGGGHPKAASATVRLQDESEAEGILQGLVDELIETSLMEQPTVGDFMTAPVLSVKPEMTEKEVEDLFTRYDVRALPVVDDDNDVIGLVTNKEVAAAKQRLWNKEQKRLREAEDEISETVARERKAGEDTAKARKGGSALKGWMKQHVLTVDAGTTMAEAEAILLENDVGCIPVTADGTKQLVGIITRTDLLRQHRYYSSLHYHNTAFADSIANRQPIIELRKRLKQFDDE